MNVWTSTTTDAALLRLYVETHSEDAFAELVRRRLALVYSAALRQLDGNCQLAEDVSQTVFIELVRKAAALVNHPTLAGWLYTAACRMAADQFRRRTRHQIRECSMATPPEPARETAIEWNQLRPILDDAMLDLPDADRHAVLLRYFEQRHFRAIGEELGLSEDAVRMRVTRALEKLRERLATRGVKSTAALGSSLMAQTLSPVPAHLASSVVTASLAIAPGAAVEMGVGQWLMANGKVVVLAIALLAVFGLVTVQLRRPVKPEPRAELKSGTGIRAQVPGVIRRTVFAAGPGGALTTKVKASLAKLRSALFDTHLSLPERGVLLQESSGELVGSELDTLPLFHEALLSSDPSVVAMAVEASGRFGTLPRELHTELMQVFRTTDSKELAGLTANRLQSGPRLGEDLPELMQLLRERPVVREALTWLIPNIVSFEPSDVEQHRQALKALLGDDNLGVRAAAAKILKELPEPTPPQAELLEQVTAKLKASEPGTCLAGLIQARSLGEHTPDVVPLIEQLASQHAAPEVRLAARQALRRMQAQEGTVSEMPNEPAEFSQKIAHGTATVPEMVAALAEGPETMKSATAALATVASEYWTTHLPDRAAAVRVLYTLLQDPDPERVEAAAAVLPKIPPGSAKSLYTLNELEPLFRVMEETLSPGEYAIAMRDFEISAEVSWKASGFGDTPPTHVPASLVQILPVGPMHENYPAYEAMVKALSQIDPRLQPPIPEKKN